MYHTRDTIASLHLPSEDDWHLLLKHAESETFTHGETIVEEGQRMYTVYQVVSGRCAVVSNGIDVGSISEGELFGDMTLLLGGECTATVKADTPHVTLLKIPGAVINELLQEDHALASRFFHYLATVCQKRLGALMRSMGELV